MLKKTIDFGEYIKLNNDTQYIHVLSKNPENPIIIYLHGGPGDAALPLVKKFNYELSIDYTLIIWEQRGAGKSYSPFKKRKEPITIDLFIKDLKSLIDYLLIKFNKEKVYLLGHSWGTLIGTKFILEFPELVYKYIGCGQITNPSSMFEMAKDFVIDYLTNERIIKKISLINTNFSQENWHQELMYLMKYVIKYKGSLYNKSSYISLYPYFIFSKDYSLKDCFYRLKGSQQSIDYLWQEVCQTNLEAFTSFDVPIVFIEGEYDFHCSSKLAFDYYTTITSKKDWYIIENTAHFPQWSNPKQFNKIVRSLKEESI